MTDTGNLPGNYNSTDGTAVAWSADTYRCLYPEDEARQEASDAKWIFTLEALREQPPTDGTIPSYVFPDCYQHVECASQLPNQDPTKSNTTVVPETLPAILPPVSAASASSTFSGQGKGPRVDSTSAGNIWIYETYPKSTDPKASSDGCHTYAMGTAVNILNDKLMHPPHNTALGPVHFHYACYLPSESSRWDTWKHSGQYKQYPGGPVQSNDPTDSCTSVSCSESHSGVLKWRAWDYFKTFAPGYMTQNKENVVLGWVSCADHNGEAMDVDWGWSIVAADHPCAWNDANWPDSRLVQHEVSHPFYGLHYPSESQKYDCGYGSIMNYCSAFNGETNYDYGNRYRIGQNIWDTSTTLSHPCKTGTSGC
ncbi:MAG: hypothetical protein ABR562_01750 [Thermoplasmatota archaeon]